MRDDVIKVLRALGFEEYNEVLTNAEMKFLSEQMVKNFQERKDSITWEEGIKRMCQGFFVQIRFKDKFTGLYSTYVYGKDSYGSFRAYDEKTGKFIEDHYLDADDIMEADWFKMK